MSREELADAVNDYLFRQTRRVFDMDGNHIGKFELGEYRWPRTHYRDALRAVLGAETNADLGFYPRRRTAGREPAIPDLPHPSSGAPPVFTPRWGGDPENTGSQACGAGLGPDQTTPAPWSPQRGAAPRPGGPPQWGAPTVAELFRHSIACALTDEGHVPAAEWRQISDEYGRTYATTHPSELLEGLAVDLRVLREHLARTTNDRDQLALRGVAARLAGLAAQCLSDLGNARMSVRWWRTAAQAADSSEDLDARTWVRGREILCGIYGHRPSRLLLGLADRVEGITVCPLPGVATAQAGRAQLLAILGDSEGARRALDPVRFSTERLLSDRPGEPESPLSVYSWSEALLRHTESVVHSYLGDLEEARQTRDAALALFPDRRAPECTHLLLHGALGLVRQGRTSEGLAQACQILSDLPGSHRRAMVFEVARHILQAVPSPERLRPEALDLRRLLVRNEGKAS